MFNLPQDLTYSEEGAASGDISSLDPEEAGFQSSFSKIGASDAGAADAFADIKDVKLFASKEISRRSQEKPGIVSVPRRLPAGLALGARAESRQISGLFGQAQQAEQSGVVAFAQYMQSNG